MSTTAPASTLGRVINIIASVCGAPAAAITAETGLKTIVAYLDRRRHG